MCRALILRAATFLDLKPNSPRGSNDQKSEGTILTRGREERAAFIHFLNGHITSAPTSLREIGRNAVAANESITLADHLDYLFSYRMEIC